MRVLLTRPEAQSRALAEVLAAKGIEVLVDPLLETVLVEGARIDLEGVQAALATSANGVRALAAATARRDVPLFAVGPATAEAARAEGFVRVETAGGDVVALASLAAAILDPAGGRLVHVAGTAVAGDLKGTLEGHGFIVERAVLYDAKPAEALREQTSAALRAGRIDGVLLFSPRTATTFVGLVEAAGLGATCRNLIAFCLSPAVADALRGLALGHVRVAQRPETEALLDLLPARQHP
jgi:uroporphyrinogen-III synthase